MGIALAVLVLTALSIGFVSLLLLPLVFIWMAVSVYAEPWGTSPPELVSELGDVDEPVQVTPPEQPVQEKPRVMVAGRRRPL